MQTQNEAGNLLPQNCPELEQFIKAQAHIRAAVNIIDNYSLYPLTQLDEEKRKYFRNLVDECFSMLWEVDGHVQNLLTAFFTPIFPIEKE